MKVICGWFKRGMGEVEPLDDPSETHGICPECQREHFGWLFADIPRVGIPTAEAIR